MLKTTPVGILFFMIASPLAGQGQSPWDNWRGPAYRSCAAGGDPPTEWSEEKNLRFKVAIPGISSSSPIIWKDRIYLMTGIETDVVGEAPIAPLEGRRFAGPTPTKEYQFAVVALERATGKRVWQKTIVQVVPHEGLHSTMTQVAASPVTDGESLYVFFGSRGLHCLDFDGKVRWSKQFGYMRTRREWGEGASPALHGDTIVVNWDHEEQSFIVALDKKTGKERWRRERDEVTSWATPLILEVEGRPQVIVPATTASRGYDLETGKVIWSLSGMTVNTIPTPVYEAGVVYLMSGYRGRMIQAVRLAGAKGDLAKSDNLLWTYEEGASYVPSGLLTGGNFYFLRKNNGVLTSLDAKTGKPNYEGERIRGLRTVYSSPVGAAGRIYITSRDGVTKVVAAGPKPQVLATNRLEDTFDATAAIVDGVIYLRGRQSLYAIAKKADD